MITVTTKNVSREYDAPTGREAIQMFWDDLRSGRIDPNDVGLIGSWHGNNGEPDGMPFRIVPSAWRCGLITQEQAVSAFETADLNFSPREIADMAEADKWMLREDDSALDAEVIG